MYIYLNCICIYISIRCLSNNSLFRSILKSNTMSRMYIMKTSKTVVAKAVVTFSAAVVTNVVENAVYGNCVDITYTHKGEVYKTSVSNINNQLVVGIPVRKYFFDQESIKFLKVSKNTKGHFSSIKEVDTTLVDIITNHCHEMVGLDMDLVKEIQILEELLSTPKAEDNFLTEESINSSEVQTTTLNVVKAVKAVKSVQRKGKSSLPVVDFKFKEVVLSRDNNSVGESMTPVQEELFFESDYMDSFEEPSHFNEESYEILESYDNMSTTDTEEDNIPTEESIDTHSVEVNVCTEDNKEMDILSLVKYICKTSYLYFDKGCTLTSLNKKQIRQQFGYIYKKDLAHLHGDHVRVGKIIGHLIDLIHANMDSKKYGYVLSLIHI